MKKLIIPVDFSETSESAIAFGLQLAEKCNYEIILHHSVDFLGTYESMYMDAPQAHSFTEEVISDMEVQLENTYRRYSRDGLKMSKRLTIGTLINDIRRLAKEEEVDLVVMGTKGASGLSEFFIGSNTEKVVRLLDCPVISVPENTDLGTIRRIMVPIDLREIRPSFLREVSKLQQLFSASVEFVWVQTPHNIENDDLIEEQMNNLLGSYEIASSSFTIVRNVFPQEGLIAYSRDNDTDMIAMATHARRGIAHWFSGSLTEDVLNHASMPLWSFKLDEKEDSLDIEKFQNLNPANIN